MRGWWKGRRHLFALYNDALTLPSATSNCRWEFSKIEKILPGTSTAETA